MDNTFYIGLAIIIFLILQTLSSNKRIRLLETKLMQVNSREYVEFAKTQLNIERVQALRVIRQNFPELSLVQSIDIYELAKKDFK